jgi:hypothetical protein
MEFITLTNKEKNIYTINNISSGKYIINFLARNDILFEVTNDFITIEVDKLGPLTDKERTDEFIHKFIYDIGSQILYLKEEKLAIKYFSLEDIIVINSNIFLFINPNKLFALLNKKHIKIDKSVKSYEYGIIDASLIQTDSPFLSPELKEKKSYLYYTSSFYSLAKLILVIFDLKYADLSYTSLYFFLNRCLQDLPENRILMFV